MKALVIAERSDAARELAGGARTLADEVVVLCFGETPEGIADKAIQLTVPENAVVEDAAQSVISLFDAEQPGVVLVEPTRRMKIIAGKLAAHAQTAVITDAISFEGGGAKSLYFGGVGERVQKSKTGVALYTVAPGVFSDATPSGVNTVEELVWISPEHPVEVIDRKAIEKSGVDLFKASAVVAAGRGFTEEADLDLARTLCEKLGAGLACSRPLTEGVDWLPRETYVGVSGLMLTPKVYVAAGISGQMQHMVGANRSGVIFAINKDKNAPVFNQCDYGLVGDLKDVLPALNAAL